LFSLGDFCICHSKGSFSSFPVVRASSFIAERALSSHVALHQRSTRSLRATSPQALFTSHLAREHSAAKSRSWSERAVRFDTISSLRAETFVGSSRPPMQKCRSGSNQAHGRKKPMAEPVVIRKRHHLTKRCSRRCPAVYLDSHSLMLIIPLSHTRSPQRG